MLRRQVERLGRDVAVIGFGGRSFVPDERKTEPRVVQRLLAEAIEAGVDLVEVAPEWGDAEALAGEAIRDLRARDRVVLCTRVGESQTPAALQAAVERSLRATRLEVLPLVQLPGVHDARLATSAWPEQRGTLERLAREGKVLAWGAIVDAPGEAAAVVAEPAFATVQLVFHALDRAAAPLVAGAAEHKTGVLVRQPLAGGALDRLDALVDRDEIADAAELALRWLIAQPITAALVGVRSTAHLQKNLAAADGRAPSPRLRARLEET